MRGDSEAAWWGGSRTARGRRCSMRLFACARSDSCDAALAYAERIGSAHVDDDHAAALQAALSLQRFARGASPSWSCGFTVVLYVTGGGAA